MSAVISAIAASKVGLAALAAFGVAAAASGVGYSIYAGEQGRKAQKEAMSQQKAAQAEATLAAREQAKASQAAIRRSQQQMPDVASIMAAAQESGAGGPAGTMLTGPTGIDPSQLTLGRNTLLGG
jgi:uncharacterized protein HemX